MYLKLTVTTTGSCYNAPNDNTTRCLLELFTDEDQVIKSYVVGVRSERHDDISDNLKTQDERVESFKKFLENNKDYFHFGSQSLYKYDATEEELDAFIIMFERQWGKNHTKGYHVISNNCTVAVESVINHFFPKNRIANTLNLALELTPYLLSLATDNGLLLPFITTLIAGMILPPGRSLPTLYNSPSNALIKAKIVSFFSSMNSVEIHESEFSSKKLAFN